MGFAPTYLIGATDAIQVASGTITSSSGPMSKLNKLKCKADVQDGKVIAYFLPKYSLKDFSKLST